jgi:hypothetical protein
MARQEVNTYFSLTRVLSVHLGTSQMTGREQDLGRAAGNGGGSFERCTHVR